MQDRSTLPIPQKKMHPKRRSRIFPFDAQAILESQQASMADEIAPRVASPESKDSLNLKSPGSDKSPQAVSNTSSKSPHSSVHSSVGLLVNPSPKILQMMQEEDLIDPNLAFDGTNTSELADAATLKENKPSTPSTLVPHESAPLPEQAIIKKQAPSPSRLHSSKNKPNELVSYISAPPPISVDALIKEKPNVKSPQPKQLSVALTSETGEGHVLDTRTNKEIIKALRNSSLSPHAFTKTVNHGIFSKKLSVVTTPSKKPSDAESSISILKVTPRTNFLHPRTPSHLSLGEYTEQRLLMEMRLQSLLRGGVMPEVNKETKEVKEDKVPLTGRDVPKDDKETKEAKEARIAKENKEIKETKEAKAARLAKEKALLAQRKHCMEIIRKQKELIYQSMTDSLDNLMLNSQQTGSDRNFRR